MAFIDNLAFSLFSISFAGLMLLYTITSMYLLYRKRGRNYSEYLKGAAIPLALIGVYLLIQGLWGQLTWPLPGSYNILFYDPMIAFGILLLSFAFAVKSEVRLEYPGFLGLLVGIMVIIYGIEGYSINLTAAPLALLGMYFAYGGAGILSYPVSLIADRLPGLQRNVWLGWNIILVLFWILLLAASLTSAYVGILAIPQHLLSPP